MATTRSIFTSKGEVHATAYIADPSSSDFQKRSLGNANEILQIPENVFFSLHVPTDFKQSIKLFNIHKDPDPNISYKCTVLVSR